MLKSFNAFVYLCSVYYILNYFKNSNFSPLQQVLPSFPVIVVLVCAQGITVISEVSKCSIDSSERVTIFKKISPYKHTLSTWWAVYTTVKPV